VAIAAGVGRKEQGERISLLMVFETGTKDSENFGAGQV